MLMYPAMTNVTLGEVGDAFRSPRQLGVVLIANDFVAPFVMLGLPFLVWAAMRLASRLFGARALPVAGGSVA
jgi:ACR3 family arsenite efflux pump ArsB